MKRLPYFCLRGFFFKAKHQKEREVDGMPVRAHPYPSADDPEGSETPVLQATQGCVAALVARICSAIWLSYGISD